MWRERVGAAYHHIWEYVYHVSSSSTCRSDGPNACADRADLADRAERLTRDHALIDHVTMNDSRSDISAGIS